MSLTRIISKVFEPRQRELDRYFNEAPALQQQVLTQLMKAARHRIRTQTPVWRNQQL